MPPSFVRPRCGSLTRFLAAAASALALVNVLGGATRPNIIVMLADDFGYECVTANGGQSYETPNLDRLAATGMRFEQCHVQPLCTPTRVQLMTGLYNVRNYVEFGAMDPRVTTFGHLLKRAGYATGVCGKWQLGLAPDSPQKFGFDESFLWWHMRRASRYPSPGFEHNGVAKDFRGQYGPQVLNDFALNFITRHKDAPFFLYYPMLLTHSPFQPTPDSPGWDAKMSERDGHSTKNFAAMTKFMDKMVGRVVAKLDELGLRENTLILFLGDNGTGGEITSQFQGKPYPGGKGRSHARGTHVPLIANWPNRIPNGRVNRDLIASVDFVPTLCAAAGAELPATLAQDGKNFLPQLLGQPGQPREWIYAWYAPDGGAAPKWEFAMSKEHKLYRDGSFFDLRADPFEEKPLRADKVAGENAAAAQKLQAVLTQYANARPAELLEPRVTAKQAKKTGRKDRKERK
jgi:arylsulfatase A